ncbi:HD domain-containing phosphohydrolase [Moritella marina]|nr:HD domain-containing phosphohydrolase [Moritella marina]
MSSSLKRLSHLILLVLSIMVIMLVLFVNSISADESLDTEFEVVEEISLISSALVYNMDYEQLNKIMTAMISNRKDIVNLVIVDDVSKGVVFSYSSNGSIKAFNGFSRGYMAGHLLPIVYEGQLIGTLNVEFKSKLLPQNNNYYQDSSFIIVFFLFVLIFINLIFYALLKLSVSSSRRAEFGSKKFIFITMSFMSIFIVMTVIGGYFILEKNKTIIEDRVELYLQKNISDFNRDMNRTKETLASIYNQITQTADFQRVYQGLVNAEKFSDEAAYEYFQGALTNIINRHHDFGLSERIPFLIMNIEGNVVAKQGNDITVNDINKTINSPFIRALSGRAGFLPPKKSVPQISEIYYGDLYFSYPILDVEGRVSGILFTQIPKLPFIYFDMSEYNFGASGELVATNNSGRIISKCRFPQGDGMNCGHMLSTIMQDRHSSSSYLELFGDYRGRESYVLTSWYDELNTILVSKMDSNEVLESYYEFQKGIILILVVMSTLTIFTTLYTLFLGRNANDKLIKSNHGIIKRLGHAAEFKDNETAMHIVRMSYYAKIIAIKHGCDLAWVELLFNAAPMHDIGKIGVPDHILQKPGKLTPDEWFIMRQHPEFGARIIGTQDNELLKMAHDIAIAHHEKWDGSGYPYGIKGEKIPLPARIIAIADVFDALTSERVYKKAWTQADAEALIISESGKHFDPSLVDSFVLSLPEIKTIRSIYVDNN